MPSERTAARTPRRAAFSIAALAAVVVAGGAAGEAAAQDRAFAPGEAIVRFDPGATAGERLAARRAADATFDRRLRVARTQVVEVDGAVAATVDRFERQPGVAFAQPNYRYRAFAPAPNDPMFGQLWGLSDAAPPDAGVDALGGWDSSRGAGRTIAVVDTGIALGHPDLAGNLWTNPSEVANGADDDGNGRVDDVHGFDFVDGDADPADQNVHGTHVAGTAAAIAGNGVGVAGVAPEARVMAVRVLDANGIGTTAAVADGVVYAAQEGADTINLSFGGPGGVGDDLVSAAVNEAAARGAAVVAAAGNGATDNDVVTTTPCTLPQDNVICVAATARGGELAAFSNYGATTVDVGAPGEGILSATPGDYVTFDGTSMSAPHIAGVLALVRGAVPSIGAAQAVQAVRQGVAPSASLQGTTVGGGVSVAPLAITAARQLSPAANR